MKPYGEVELSALHESVCLKLLPRIILLLLSITLIYYYYYYYYYHYHDCYYNYYHYYRRLSSKNVRNFSPFLVSDV